jgi:hypothetical protein
MNGDEGIEVVFKRLTRRVLKSQCVPTDSSLWAVDQAEAFWQARRELLAESFNGYVRPGLPHRRV